MTEHYNAFISYKHAPEDNRVAEAVHKGLERFHIPHRIRKKTGIKRINRIFRDKDELPITSDLSDSIAHALADTDYLIVICSTNTKESMWVPREIEYFLKNHSKRDIFTVLVNGEPADVIPDILKYEDKVVNDENGNEVSVRIPIEPLSCDFRTGLRKARRTELPRLVSGIIGCAYDELMNRRRQYRMKQLLAVGSIVLAVMAAFCAYMYYSRDRIRKNYLESLRNQSKYLANESENLLEKEQRITALQLALEAVPRTEDDDRPVTAEAVRALTDATLAYEGDNGNNINAAWNYQMPGNVSDFYLSGNGEKIAVVDEGGVIAVWSTQDHKRTLYLEDLDTMFLGTGFLDDVLFAVWDKDTLVCYDTDSGEEVWRYVLEDDTFTGEGNLMPEEKSFYIGTDGGDYLKIETASGKLIGKASITKESGYEEVDVVESKLSPDGRHIAFRALGEWSSYAYGCLDIGSGSTVMSDILDEMVKDVEWIDDDTFAVASTAAGMDSSMSFGNAQVLSTDHSALRCVDAHDLSEKWSADFTCNGVTIESGFVKLGNDRVAYYSGNVITVYDTATGAVDYSSNVNDSVIDVSDRDGDGNPTYITENGGYATPALSIDDDAVYYNPYFTDEIRQVEINNGVYVRRRYGHEVIYYGVHVYDDEWTPLADDAHLKGSVLESLLEEDKLVTLSLLDDMPMLDVFTLGETNDCFNIKLGGDKAFSYKILGVYGGTVYLGYENGFTYDVLKLDQKAGKTGSVFTFEMGAIFDNALSMNDGRLAFVYRTDDAKTELAVYDLTTGDKKDYELPDDIGSIVHEPVYYKDQQTVWLRGDRDIVIDLADGSVSDVETSDDWGKTQKYSQNSENGLYAATDGKNILIADKDGKVKTVISCPGVTPLGMTFDEGRLLVLYSDGALFWYAEDDGEMIRNSDVSVYYNYSGPVVFQNDKDKGILFIMMENVTDTIDLESAYETAVVLDCFGYHSGRDIFITSAKGDDNDKKIGYYRRYSVDDLIGKAEDILKGVELTDELKSRYGLMEENAEKSGDTGLARILESLGIRSK